MVDSALPGLPAPTPDQRRVAAGQFERANQVLATGNHDYAIQLLLNCCKLDPANLIYRHALRQTQRAKYKNKGHGSRFALLTNSAAWLRLKSARSKGNHVKVVECVEEILTRNPWELSAQEAMAEAFEALGLREQAIWTLEQARHRNARHAGINRGLARLHEKDGNFKRAMHLWGLVRKADPADVEARQKLKDLAATDTIARGKLEEMLQADGKARPNEEPRPEPKAARPPEPAQPVVENDVELPATDEPMNPEEELLARINAEPRRPDAYLLLAARYRRSDRFDEACAILTQGLARTGNDFHLAVELADLEVEPFRQNLAIAEARLREQPEDEELYRLRIRLLKEINTRELYLYRQKAERYPTELGYRYEFGLRLLRAGQLDEAILELQAARADPRYQWRALAYLGYAFKQRNNWRLAQRNFEEALQYLPAGEDVYRKELLYLLAQGAADAGDLAKALERAEELAHLDFAYREIGQLMDEWQVRLRESDSLPPP